MAFKSDIPTRNVRSRSGFIRTRVDPVTYLVDFGGPQGPEVAYYSGATLLGVGQPVVADWLDEAGMWMITALSGEPLEGDGEGGGGSGGGSSASATVYMGSGLFNLADGKAFYGYSYASPSFGDRIDYDSLPTGGVASLTPTPSGEFLWVRAGSFIRIYTLDLTLIASSSSISGSNSARLYTISETTAVMGVSTGSVHWFEWDGDATVTDIGTDSPSAGVMEIVVSPDKSQIAIDGISGSDQRKMSVYEIDPGPSLGSLVARSSQHANQLSVGLAWSPDGTKISAGFRAGTRVATWPFDGTSFGAQYTPSEPPGAFANSGVQESIDYSPDSKYLGVASTGTPWIQAYDQTGGVYGPRLEPDTLPTTAVGGATTIKWNSAGDSVAVGTDDQPGLHIYNWSDGFESGPFTPDEGSFGAQVSSLGWAGDTPAVEATPQSLSEGLTADDVEFTPNNEGNWHF